MCAPTRVRVDTDAQTLTIEWSEPPSGQTSVFPLRRLREACPCANCGGHEIDHIDPPEPSDPEPDTHWTNLHVEPAGSVGIRITWDDGHNDGIYRWDRLRRLQSPSPE